MGQSVFSAEPVGDKTYEKPGRPANPTAEASTTVNRPSFESIKITYLKMQEQKRALMAERELSEKRRQAREELAAQRTAAKRMRQEFRESLEKMRTDALEQARKLAEERKEANRKRGD